MKPERIRFHDGNLRPAWRKHFGREATLNERVIALSVAIGETGAGDAWPGLDGIVGTADDERNKGATNLRALNVHERAVIAAKGRELIAARPDIPAREFPHPEDRLDFTAVGEAGDSMRFRWLFHRPHSLRRGESGGDVKRWQEFLELNAIDVGAIDGKFGDKTEAGTKEWQQAKGIPASGIVDADTQERAGLDFMRPFEVALTLDEAEVVAPLTPTVAKGHETRARAMNALLAEALPDCPAGETPAPTERFPEGAHGTIHFDSHPGLGPFAVWFASFDTPKPDGEDEVDSWVYYLRILGRTDSERASLAAGSASLMARAMYQARYYGGFHIAGKMYESPKGSGNLVDGAELNIRDYASVISRTMPSVRSALA